MTAIFDTCRIVSCDKCGREIKGPIYNLWPATPGCTDLGRDWQQLHPECASAPPAEATE